MLCSPLPPALCQAVGFSQTDTRGRGFKQDVVNKIPSLKRVHLDECPNLKPTYYGDMRIIYVFACLVYVGST